MPSIPVLAGPLPEALTLGVLYMAARSAGAGTQVLGLAELGVLWEVQVL